MIREVRQVDDSGGLIPRLLLSPLLLADRSRVFVPENKCGGALVCSSLLRDCRCPRKKKLETPNQCTYASLIVPLRIRTTQSPNKPTRVELRKMKLPREPTPLIL